MKQQAGKYFWPRSHSTEPNLKRKRLRTQNSLKQIRENSKLADEKSLGAVCDFGVEIEKDTTAAKTADLSRAR